MWVWPPFNLVEHRWVVMVGVVLVGTALVVGFGTDLPVIVDDHLPVADLPLPAHHHHKSPPHSSKFLRLSA